MSRCPICQSPSEPVYRPAGSRIGLTILVCEGCGFVHSRRSREPIQYTDLSELDQTLSSDADYSAGRVCKQQMTTENIDLFGNVLQSRSPRSILDMAAARGHFLHYAAQGLGVERVVGIEADPTLLHRELVPDRAEIIGEDFREVSLDEKFDLVYSCHTLEHYADPMPHLRFIRDHLNREGAALIDLPNLDSITSSEPLDEFFYDKHRTYFDIDTLHYALSQVGLDLLADQTTVASIKLLVGRTSVKDRATLPPETRPADNCHAIDEYAMRLDRNRHSLPSAVDHLVRELDGARPTVLIGAGRVLDAAVRYGHLDPQRFDYIVDNFLWMAGVTISGRAVVRLTDLPPLARPQVVVMARTATQQLRQEVQAWNAGATVQVLTDYL